MSVEVYCEGYHDRSFWVGLFERAGFKGDRTKSSKGQYFLENGEVEIRIIPCEGKSNITKAVKARLKRIATDPLEKIIVNLDPDLPEFVSRPTKQKCEGILKKLAFQYKDLDHYFEVSSPPAEGAAPDLPFFIYWVVWGTAASGGEHLPEMQTLERMVCQAILTAYPERGPQVSDFLNEAVSQLNPKAYMWSHMAKWFPKKGCDAFFLSLWQDENTALALEAIMKGTGAWKAIESFLPSAK